MNCTALFLHYASVIFLKVFFAALDHNVLYNGRTIYHIRHIGYFFIVNGNTALLNGPTRLRLGGAEIGLHQNIDDRDVSVSIKILRSQRGSGMLASSTLAENRAFAAERALSASSLPCTMAVSS